MIVAWGSQEQFTAAFRDEGGHGPQGVPIGSTLLLPLTFEVASNATQASLFFEEHKVPVDLQGSSVPIERYDDTGCGAASCKPRPVDVPDYQELPF